MWEALTRCVETLNIDGYIKLHKYLIKEIHSEPWTLTTLSDNRMPRIGFRR